jgi:hypothetical protein
MIAILGRALVVGGALALGWYGYVRFEMLRTERETARLLELPPRAPIVASRPPAVSNLAVIAPPRSRDLLGRIEIPRIHLSAPVMEGDTPNSFARPRVTFTARLCRPQETSCSPRIATLIFGR